MTSEAIWLAEMGRSGFDRNPDIWFNVGERRYMKYWFIDGDWYWRLTEGDVLLAEGAGEP